MDPIRYTLSFPAPHTHYVHVRAEVPAAGRDSVELSMAVWTPGSYLVREFSRHVESVTAESAGGIALRVEKTAKNRWRVVSSPRARKRIATTSASPVSPGLPARRSGNRCTNSRVSESASAPLNASGARSDARGTGRDASENMATMSASRAGTNDAL